MNAMVAQNIKDHPNITQPPSNTNPSNPSPSTGASSVPLISSLGWGATGLGQVTAVGINFYIAVNGVFPSANGVVDITEPYLGQIMMFAGSIVPGSWVLCDGALLDISTNTALYMLLGTTYGGDGITTFAVPNLSARVPMGVGTLTSFTSPSDPPGSPSVPLITSMGLGQTAQGQIGTLGMNFYIATTGVFPSANSNSSSAYYLGQLLLFAGNFAPTGWASCDGTPESIFGNAALYTLIGTSFGGDGVTNFDLPNLSASVPMGVK